MKKLNNKGFTLIEIVIVIVIIAILAAMLVPSLTQWIDKSKQKTFISACGTIKTAAAAVVAEDYSTGEGDAVVDSNGTVSFGPKALSAIAADVNKKVGTSKTDENDYAITSYNYKTDTMTVTDGKFTATSSNGGSWKIS